MSHPFFDSKKRKELQASSASSSGNKSTKKAKTTKAVDPNNVCGVCEHDCHNRGGLKNHLLLKHGIKELPPLVVAEPKQNSPWSGVSGERVVPSDRSVLCS